MFVTSILIEKFEVRKKKRIIYSDRDGFETCISTVSKGVPSFGCRQVWLLAVSFLVSTELHTVGMAYVLD